MMNLPHFNTTQFKLHNKSMLDPHTHRLHVGGVVLYKLHRNRVLVYFTFSVSLLCMCILSMFSMKYASAPPLYS